MGPLIPAGTVLGAAALALGWVAVRGLSWGSLAAALGRAVLDRPLARPLALRWKGLALDLGRPSDDPSRRLGTSLALVAASLVAGALAPVAGALLLFLSVLPPLALERDWARRNLALERELPWTLDLLCLGVQAGLDFEVALDRSTRARSGPLAAEIQQVLSRIRMGVSRRQALMEWGERAALPPLQALTGALVQADATGGSLTPVLKAQAESVRVRQLQRSETQAQRAPVKMLFPLVFCIFPVTFLVLFGPIFLSVSW
jgi:tight adherence protein C